MRPGRLEHDLLMRRPHVFDDRARHARSLTARAEIAEELGDASLGRDDQAEAEGARLGRVLLDAELGHVEGAAAVEIVESQLVEVAPPGAAQVADEAVLDVGEQVDLVEEGLGLLRRPPGLGATCRRARGSVRAR
jgi:hypothetical protein